MGVSTLVSSGEVPGGTVKGGQGVRERGETVYVLCVVCVCVRALVCAYSYMCVCLCACDQDGCGVYLCVVFISVCDVYVYMRCVRVRVTCLCVCGRMACVCTCLSVSVLFCMHAYVCFPSLFPSPPLPLYVVVEGLIFVLIYICLYPLWLSALI